MKFRNKPLLMRGGIVGALVFCCIVFLLQMSTLYSVCYTGEIREDDNTHLTFKSCTNLMEFAGMLPSLFSKYILGGKWNDITLLYAIFGIIPGFIIGSVAETIMRRLTKHRLTKHAEEKKILPVHKKVLLATHKQKLMRNMILNYKSKKSNAPRIHKIRKAKITSKHRLRKMRVSRHIIKKKGKRHDS